MSNNESKESKDKAIKEYKQKELMINLMNYYHKNTAKIFRYAILVSSILMFIYFIYIILPESTKNGVDSGALKQTNITPTDLAFVISPIDNRYSMDDAKRYTNKVVGYIDQRDNQVIYKATLDFLLSNCNLKLNNNTQYLFDTLYNKVQQESFIDKLDSENTVKRTNLQLCQEKHQSDENNLAVSNELEDRKNRLEGALEAQQEQRNYDKEIYGDAYDEKTGRTRYQEKDQRSRQQEDARHVVEDKLRREYENTTERIKEVDENKALERQRQREEASSQ